MTASSVGGSLYLVMRQMTRRADNLFGGLVIGQRLLIYVPSGHSATALGRYCVISRRLGATASPTHEVMRPRERLQ